MPSLTLHTDPSYHIAKETSHHQTVVEIQYHPSSNSKGINSIHVFYLPKANTFDVVLFSRNAQTNHDFKTLVVNNGGTIDGSDTSFDQNATRNLSYGTMDRIISKMTADGFLPPIFKTLLGKHLVQQTPSAGRRP